MNVRIQEDFMTKFNKTRDMLVFLFLLLNADDKGEVTFTISKISNDTGYTIQQVRTVIENLLITKLITKVTTNQRCIITICNIDKYIVRKKVKQQTQQQKSEQTTNTTEESAEPTKEERFLQRMAEVYPNVAKLKKPLTLAQYNTYLETYPNELIKQTLLDMENYKKLSTLYIDANLTLGKWLKKASSS